ncbi:Gx transporter family protein [Oscillibacter sp. MSJ-2]|uniref:Gx transporter family protein n=1 Tax=Dysosmobacter acutus TaxID=2841504 RepID=A0ABS6F781_9FIRM|nr:Gx transporter family protein [Dysosmobacter acutus]MBU5626117.1 Gx transporter family protein [Dysosmobacter acutus]
MRTKKLAEPALLATIALTIFMVELRIPNPIPIPGVKLGLANIVTVYAVYRYRPGDVLLLVLTRIILGAIFGGNLMALLYSLSGGLLCLCGMIPLRHVIPAQMLWAASVLGAVLHNVGQILAAFAVTGTSGIFIYFPFLLVSGCCTGLFTGLCAQFLVKRVFPAAQPVGTYPQSI